MQRIDLNQEAHIEEPISESSLTGNVGQTEVPKAEDSISTSINKKYLIAIGVTFVVLCVCMFAIAAALAYSAIKYQANNSSSSSSSTTISSTSTSKSSSSKSSTSTSSSSSSTSTSSSSNSSEECVAEGQVAGLGHLCCSGLKIIGYENPDPNGVCRYGYGGGGYCTTCGNGVCSAGENKCNCPSDCDDPSVRTCNNVSLTKALGMAYYYSDCSTYADFDISDPNASSTCDNTTGVWTFKMKNPKGTTCDAVCNFDPSTTIGTIDYPACEGGI
jgi:hypothetical protein